MWFRQEFRGAIPGDFPKSELLCTGLILLPGLSQCSQLQKTCLLFYHCHIAVVRFCPINLRSKDQTFYFATGEKFKTYSALTHLTQIVAWVERRLWWRKAHAGSICKNTGHAQQHPTDLVLFIGHKLTVTCQPNHALCWGHTALLTRD